MAVAYRRGDLVAVLDIGAYGMVMASDYNGQPRPAEVVVAGSEALLSRQWETWGDLLAWGVAPGPSPPGRCPPAHQPAGSPEAEGLIVSSTPPTLPSPRAVPPRAVARGYLRGASERLG